MTAPVTQLQWRPDEETPEQLHTQLIEAEAAAREAYRDSARLIRLLTVVGQPAPPDELVDATLAVLSEVFVLDVTCVAHVVGNRLVVTHSCGLPEDDPAFVDGWDLCDAAAEAVRTGRAVARHAAGTDIPVALAALGIQTAAWVPLSADQDASDQLLVLFRRDADRFAAADLQILGSVTSRLGLSLAERQRSIANAQLVRYGHRLNRYLDLQPLLDEAADLLRQLTAADTTTIVTVDRDSAHLRATSGAGPALAVGWPRPVELLPGWAEADSGRPHSEEYTGSGSGAALAGGPAMLLSVPVLRDGRPTALLYAARDRRRPFSKDVVDTTTIFASYVGAAMVNADLYRALGQSEASLRLITDSISDMITVVDPAGTIVYASPSHARELAHEPGRLLSRGVAELVHPEDRDRFRAALADASRTGKVEYRILSGHGSWIWVESALRPAPAAGTTVDGGIVLSSRVVDERKRLEDELRQRATHDPLTGLANRALAGERLDAALGRVDETQVGLLFCDLDRFKAVNDRLGHEAGDDLLLQVASRLRQCLRPSDLLARFGGDEFVFVLDGVRELTDLTEVGRRVLRALEDPFTLGSERVSISASVGGVLGQRGASTASEMLRDADAAMYEAKEQGRGKVEVFDEDASSRSLDRLGLRSDLLRALDRNELSVHYQPIFMLRTGRIIAFEALLRWNHPERGPVPPDVFIPLAEETGVIAPIGDWVLRESCRQLAEWQALAPGRRLAVNVNLSATQLQQPGLATEILATIGAAGVDPADVWLEVTEHALVRGDVTEFATTLRAAGVHFALDDFGVSYSSLGYLKRFPTECLKIDRSFVAALSDGEGDRGVVRAILAVADELRLDVVAEGIETEQQRTALLALGCGRGQGYLLSRPVPATEATALLSSPPRLLAPVDAGRPGNRQVG